MNEAITTRLAAFDLAVISWMNRHGRLFLRLALGIVFIWFGALKLFGVSPAEGLIREVTAWMPVPGFVVWLGIWEVLIGVCFLVDRLVRAAIPLLFLHMPGTALPFVLAPDRVWNAFPFALTTEGQYIVKNVVLVAAALVIGGSIRLRMSGLGRFEPDELPALLQRGEFGHAPVGEVLVEEGRPNDRVYFIRGGEVEVVVNGEPTAVRGPHSFIGEMSFLTEESAGATVRARTPIDYIAWTHDELRRLIERQPGLGQAIHASLSRDLVDKLRTSRNA